MGAYGRGTLRMVERALHENVGCHKMGRRVGAYGTEAGGRIRCAGQSLVACFAAVFVTALVDTLEAALVAARGSSASTIGAALGWLWKVGGFAWLVLVTGEGDGWSRGRLRRQPGAGIVGDTQQDDESLTRDRARGIWARWCRVRWHVSRRVY